MSLAHQNPSAETRRKMSLAKKGTKLSDQHRKNISDTLQTLYASGYVKKGKKKYKTEEERLEARRRQARERRQKPENKKKDQEYYQKNKKKIKIQHSIYNQKNREHNNQKARERRAANPEKHRKYGLKSYYKNASLW